MVKYKPELNDTAGNCEDSDLFEKEETDLSSDVFDSKEEFTHDIEQNQQTNEDRNSELISEVDFNFNYNPWAERNLIDFYFFCCPECDYKEKDSVAFHNHAIDQHKKVKIMYYIVLG